MPWAARRGCMIEAGLPRWPTTSFDGAGPLVSQDAATDRLSCSEGLAAFWAYCELPSFEGSRASLCHHLAAADTWSVFAAPRVVHRAKFPWRRGAAVGLTSWPRSPFHRPPAKADGLREDQSAFHRLSRARAGVAPFARSLGLSVTPPLRGIAIVRPTPFRLRSKRLALTSQASRCSSESGEDRGLTPVPSCSRSALSVSTKRTRSRIDVPRTSEAIDNQTSRTAQHKKALSINFFIHRLPTALIHSLSPARAKRRFLSLKSTFLVPAPAKFIY